LASAFVLFSILVVICPVYPFLVPEQELAEDFVPDPANRVYTLKLFLLPGWQ